MSDPLFALEVHRPKLVQEWEYSISNSTAQKFQENHSTLRKHPTKGSADYYFLNNLRAGLFKLRTQAVDSKYVWVILNNKLLKADVDYSVTTDKNFVKLVKPLS